MSYYSPSTQETLSDIQSRMLALRNPDDAAKPLFTKGMVVIDIDSPQAHYSYPNATISVIDHQFDGENPDLGAYQIAINIFFYDASTPAGVRQLLSAERVLMQAVNLIRENLGNVENGAAGAAWWYTGHDAPSPQAEKGSAVVWGTTVYLTQLRG